MKSVKLFMIGAVAMLLSACGIDSLSEGAGQFRANVEVGVMKEGEVAYIKNIEVVDGKESASFEASLAFKDGKPVVTVSRTDSKAFEGQAIAGRVVEEVNKEFAKAGVNMTGAIVEAITKGVLGK